MRLLISCFVTLILASCGGGGGGSSPTPVQVANRAPVVTDPGALTLLEGASSVATISANDPDNNALSFSISSGDDQALFSISSSGALSFSAAPDFESPSDAGSNNVYDLTVQVSDGTLTDTQSISITVTDAFEGRVVDAPVRGALVFIDLNGNNELDDGEPSGLTNAQGNYSFPTFMQVLNQALEDADIDPSNAYYGDVATKIISIGGTDIQTGKDLPDLVMVSDLPSDLTKPAMVTPISTVLAAAASLEAKSALLAALGIIGTVDDFLASDVWAKAQNGDEKAKAAQRINQQIGVLLQTATTLTDDDDSTTDVSVILARSVAKQIATIAASDSKIDLTSAATVQKVLTDAAAETVPNQSIEPASIAAIANAVAVVNTLAADVSLDPTSDTAKDISIAMQGTLQTSVEQVVSGNLTVADFATNTAPTLLFSDIVVAADAPDYDADGISDALDPDDDNDGVRDSLDAFPKDATETLDTDSDGTGNNTDTDDDGDGVADTADGFPLDKYKSFLTGYFTDSAVEGLNYATETQSGVTNNLGAFTYLEGETISFTIGKFVLGDTVAAKAAMTPLDLTAPSLSLPTTNGELNFLNKKVQLTARPFGEGINFAKFQNLLVLLQSLDSDKDASNGISIPDGMSALLEGVELDFEADPFLFKRAFAFRKVMAEAVTGSLIADGFIKTSEYALTHYYEQQEINTLFTQVEQASVDKNANSVTDEIYTYTYDANGNQLTFSDDRDADSVADDIFTYTYDANGNQLTESYEYGGVSLQEGAQDSFHTYTYDANGNQLTARYEYDAVSLAKGYENRIYNFTYDANGNKLTSRAFTFDRQLTSNDYNGNGTADDTFTYTYDASGNQLTDSYDDNGNDVPETLFTYTYDANGNQLTQSSEYGDDYLGQGLTNSISTRTYDANGNQLTESNNNVPDDITTRTYDANGNVLTVSSEYGDVSLANGFANSITTSTYDANGNKLTKSYVNKLDDSFNWSSTYTYDANGNKLTKSYVNKFDDSVNYSDTFTYDANGNLVTQIEDRDGDITKTTYTNVGSKIKPRFLPGG